VKTFLYDKSLQGQARLSQTDSYSTRC